MRLTTAARARNSIHDYKFEPQRRRATEKRVFYLDQALNPDDSIRDPLTHAIIAGAIEVHKHLGPGLLESA